MKAFESAYAAVETRQGFLGNRLLQLESQLNTIIYKLYELTDDEIEIIENSIGESLEQLFEEAEVI